MIEIDYEKASGKFYYDETSTSCLRHMTGQPAGYLCKTSGYYKVTIAGQDVMAHRVVFCLNNRGIPNNLTVDHINGVKSDNKIENLRCVPQVVNTHNTGVRCDNTSGVKGVHNKVREIPSGKTFSYWVATWMEGGKVKEKAFSMLRHGDSAFDLTVKFRLAKLDALNSTGAEYTARHKGIINTK